jgi:uncharacterized protein YbaR (Trm112 family)
MMPADLLNMLRCPDDRSPLVEAETAVVARLNADVAAGKLRNRGGDVVAQPLDGGLVRSDGRYLYPIVDGIPVLLVDEAIPLAPAGKA